MQADRKSQRWASFCCLDGEGSNVPKRVGNLYDKITDESFIRKTVLAACYGRHKRKDVAAVLSDIDGVVSRLKKMLTDGSYVPSRYSELRIYDESSQKHRNIKTLPFYPDCLVQWLIVEAMKKPVFLRGMDHWCCASIPGRGGNRVYKGIRHYIRHHHRSAKYALQMDVHHYYDSINIDKLMDKLRRRCKDDRILTLIELVTRASSADGNIGIAIGYHLNQWLANFFLEDIDRTIRDSGLAGFYCRYMDNMTIIGSNKRKLRKLRNLVAERLSEIGLELKDDWQIFPLSSRPIQAVGYRFMSNGKVIFRKRNWLKMRRQILRIGNKLMLGWFIPKSRASAFLSRFGTMRKYAPSRRIFIMARHIDFMEVRRIAA